MGQSLEKNNEYFSNLKNILHLCCSFMKRPEVICVSLLVIQSFKVRMM